jgi:DNA-binding NtrC family response regulator
MQPTRKWRSILVFEPDTQTLNIASIVLGSMGNLQVLACRSLTDAIHAIENDVPDVMLIDVNTDQSGWRDAQFLNTQVRSEAIPCILLMDDAQQSSLNQSSYPWVIGCIFKPIDPLTFAEDILGILENVSLETSI